MKGRETERRRETGGREVEAHPGGGVKSMFKKLFKQQGNIKENKPEKQ